MPSITINGKKHEFRPGQSILQVALDHEVEIPHYCYHPGLSVVASCRICLAEVWVPNAKTGKLEAIPKLVPTCQQAASDGMVVYSDSPKATANQKAVMEYLLINHPVDCPVCDKAGECHLQDYSYQYGRGQSRFEEEKVKQPKKDVGPGILLYADRCIMCTRCVRFTREVTGTGELMVDGRGNRESIDVFPGAALDNELAGCVTDICPVGALLDKDFLFQQRVWYLKKSPAIDGITASGDNLWVEQNENRVYRVRPRENLEVNKWWTTDEIRHGWKFVHSEERLSLPVLRGAEPFVREDAADAWDTAILAVDRQMKALGPVANKRLALLVSPMLTCEDAYWLARYALEVDPQAVLGVGPVPMHGAERTFPGGYATCAEKAPNARGVRRTLEAVAQANRARGNGTVHAFDAFLAEIAKPTCGAAIVTGNYPSEWFTPALVSALAGKHVTLFDTLPNRFANAADVLLPAAAWLEKAGTFENRHGRLQTFPAAILPLEFARSEAQIALDLLAEWKGTGATRFDAAATRAEMARVPGLEGLATAHDPVESAETVESDMPLVEL
jgi:NADH-quinone oxidoreductase subunit G